MRIASKIATGLLCALLTSAAAAQQKPQVYTAGDDIQVPQLLQEVKPEYTVAAKKEGIQGSVWLEAVVLADGKVGDVRVTQSLDTKYGLDDEAVKAMKQWRFRPGTKDGKPVAVRVDVEMTFTLK